ncbi:MAG TPA: HAMP domain-containing protein [Thermoanaerobaculia bacterium]|jgi:nitrogen fixation/metabolism regulation signal transduction histidine kinase|nr:HAMP domain-containing protein [Thermoanaerobaculia bacterium]
MVNLQQVRGSGVRFTLPYFIRFSGMWVLVTSLVAVVFGVTSYLAMFDQLSEGAARRLLVVLSIQTALVIVAVILLAIFSTHRLAGPLIGLQRAMEDVKAGNLSRELRFRSTDPHLDEIAATFNEMVAALRERAKTE